VDPRILSPHLIRIRCIASSITFMYVKNLQFCKFFTYMNVIEDAIQRMRTRCGLKILGSTHLYDL